MKSWQAYTPSCKKVVIEGKNFCNLVRTEYIKRQKKIKEAEPLLLSFNYSFLTNLQKFFPSMTTFLQLGVPPQWNNDLLTFIDTHLSSSIMVLRKTFFLTFTCQITLLQYS